MARATRQSWALVALDCAVDTTTPAGEAMANVLATFAQFERRLIGQRTREALAVKRAEGVRLGRPSTIPPGVAERIRRERARGATLRQIADRLNSDGIPTARGGWQSLKNRRQPSPPETKNPAYAGLLRTAGAGFEPATFGL